MQALKQAREAAAMGGVNNQQVGDEYDSQNIMQMSLISGNQKMVQMIPLELTAAAASRNGHTGEHLSTKSNSSSFHPRSSVIVNESNSNFDDAELDDDEDMGPFDDESYDNSEFEASSPKRLKIDLSANSSSGGLQQSLEGDDSGRSLDGLSVASSVCSSLETENTHSSCTSQAGGKKRKQSNPKKVIASAETAKTTEEGNDNAVDAAVEGDEGEEEVENEAEEELASGGDKVMA